MTEINNHIKQSDLYKFLSKLIDSTEYTTLVGEPTKEEAQFIKNIKSMEYIVFEEPDGFIKLQDKTVIVEHFSVDSSEPIVKKGKNKGTLVNMSTKGKPHTFERDLMMNAIPSEIKSVEELESSAIFKENLKKYAFHEHLLNNFARSYNDHFSKIENYKNRVADSGEDGISSNFEIAFFVEDVTPIDQQIPNLLELCSEADFLEKQRNNMGYYVSEIKDKPVDHLVVLSIIAGKVRVFYASKRMISNLRMLPSKTSEELVKNLDKLHTTSLGSKRVKRNLGLQVEDVVEWCKNQITKTESIERRGKNWYITKGDAVITVNAHSYTVITAHKRREKNETHNLDM